MKKLNYKESSNEVTLEEVEKMYGKDVADALVKYCDEKEKEPFDVLNDTREDKLGMTQWDWFDKWAKRILKLDVMGGFDDDFDYTGADSRAREEKGLREYDEPVFLESGRFNRGLLIELIEDYAQARVDKAAGDRTAGIAAKIAYDKLNKMLDEIM